MKEETKLRLKNGLILGTILGVAVSAVFWYFSGTPVYLAFIPVCAGMGAAQAYLS